MNISISEIIVILLIALLVIKPEQLPDVAFTMGRWFRMMKQFFSKISSEFDDILNDKSTSAKKWSDESKRE